MKQRPWWIAAAQFTGLGWWVATAIVAPTLAGAWLDGRIGSAPAFLLAGLALGLAAAAYGAYRMASGYLGGGRSSERDHGEG